MIHKNCPPVLLSYLRYLEAVKNLAPNTVSARCMDIRGFLQYLQYHKEIHTHHPNAQALPMNEIPVNSMDVATVAAVTEDDVEDYLDYLLQTRKVSEQTIYRRKASSLRMFYDYLIRHQDEFGISIVQNPVREAPAVTSPASPCKVLSPSEIYRVLKAVEGEAATRDTAIILLISTTGVSLGELVRIRCEDYREDTLLVAGRKVYLTEGCRNAIDTYLQEFRDPAKDWLQDKTLFVSHNYRRRLTPRGVQKALQKHFDKAGVQGTARDLRHTAAIALLKTARNDCERSYIAGYLGYTNARSIQDLPLAKQSTEAPNLTEGTWLEDLGRKL